MALSKVLIRSDWIFWTMRMLSLYMLHAGTSVCLSVSLFPSAPTSNFENDSQTQLNSNSVSPCGLWLSGKHFWSPRSYHKTSKGRQLWSDFFQAIIDNLLWPLRTKPYRSQNTKPEEHHTFCSREQEYFRINIIYKYILNI